MRFPRWNALLLLLLVMISLEGCASMPESSDSGPHAECLVCKKNADLACVNIAVTEKTPTYLYLGESYFFCSDECRTKFVKEPGTFVKK